MALRHGDVVATMAERVRDRDSGWKVINPHGTIRWTREVPTPEWAKKKVNGFPTWSDTTYDQHVFLTAINKTVICECSVCPWTCTSGGTIPLWLAGLILDDPPLALDSERVLALRATRKHGQGGVTT